MISEQFAAEIRSKITNKVHKQQYYGAIEMEEIKDHGTTTLSVIDPYGNAVTVTSSINLE